MLPKTDDVTELHARALKLGLDIQKTFTAGTVYHDVYYNAKKPASRSEIDDDDEDFFDNLPV